MRVAKWGNSLAVRLHAAVVDALWSEDMQNALVLGVWRPFLLLLTRRQAPIR